MNLRKTARTLTVSLISLISMVRPDARWGAGPPGTFRQDLSPYFSRVRRGRLISIGPQLAGLREMVVMMFGYGYGASWPVWGIALMWLGMIAVIGLIIWAVYGATRSSSQRGGSGPGEDAAAPGRILDERLARGDIDTEEHARLREALASHH
jgi:putative membrane protein